jgi:FkbM family methyltransferase
MELTRDLVFDVGMHQGEDTAFYLRKGYRVVGFEASPSLAEQCRSRFANEIRDGRVTIVEGAIAAAGESTVTFFVHKHMTIWGTTDEDWVERNAMGGESDRIEVPAVDFGDHLREAVPWFMKVDIEGADRLCLEELAAVRERPAFVSIESEKADFSQLVEEVALLETLGYDRFAPVQQDRMTDKEIQAVDLDGHPFRHRFEYASSGPFGEDLTEAWLTREELLRRYQTIFRRYRLLGDEAPLNRSRLGFQARKLLSKVMRTPLPGWYDTHAARSAIAMEPEG